MLSRIFVAGLMSLAALAQNAEEQVKQADRRWAEATIKMDIPTLEQLLADDLTYSHSSGRTETKAEFLNATKTQSLKYEAVDAQEVKVRVRGNMAVLNSLTNLTVRPAGGQSNTFRARILRVYVRDKGAWRLFAHQSTRMP